MSSLAASFLATCILLLSANYAPFHEVAPRLNDVVSQSGFSSNEDRLWKKLGPSIVLLMSGDDAKGTAACIDGRGYYIAHQNSLDARSIKAVGLSGVNYGVKELARDSATGLVLLQLSSKQSEEFVPIKVSDENLLPQERVMAVLPTGPLRAEVTRVNIIAAIKPSNQAAAINEIRFDAPVQLLAGAILFDRQGQLLGLLGATLPSGQTVAANAAPKSSGMLNYLKYRFIKGRNSAKLSAGENQYGPSGLTVAYALAPLMLERVVIGFRSPNHQVLHPALGAICADEVVANQEVGARVVSIVNGSSAAKAGLQTGDVIVNIDGTSVHNQIEYAKLMLTKEVGQRSTFVFRRNGETIARDIVIGKWTKPQIGGILFSIPPLNSTDNHESSTVDSNSRSTH